MTDTTPYLDVAPSAGRAFMLCGVTGPVVMLNLLRFCAVADYTASPQLAPAVPISGREAFIAWNSDAAYLAGIGHRTAAIEDSRLLPTISHIIDKD